MKMCSFNLYWAQVYIKMQTVVQQETLKLEQQHPIHTNPSTLGDPVVKVATKDAMRVLYVYVPSCWAVGAGR